MREQGDRVEIIGNEDNVLKGFSASIFLAKFARAMQFLFLTL